MDQVQLYDDRLDFEENKTRGPFGNYAKRSTPYKNSGEPGYEFFGIPIYSPFGIAAGPLPTSRFIKSALDHGFDVVTLKSVRTRIFPLNPYPQVRPVVISGQLDPMAAPLHVGNKYHEPLAIANSFGIPSVKASEWSPEMSKSLQLPKKGQAVLVAFQGTARGRGRDDFVQDHVKGISLIKKAGGQIIEINLSCPNEGEKVLACFDTDITERIVRAVRKAHPDITLIIKLAYFADHKQLKELIKKVGGLVDGISAINTIPHAVVNRAGKPVFPGRPKAGISGAPIRWAGLEMTRQLNEYRDYYGYGFKILGIGGVLVPEDYHAYIKSGADYVFSVTGAMWNPLLAAEIKASL